MRQSEFWRGFRATIPLVVGAIPFGIIFGALAVNSGLSPGAAVAMSAFVFAGSSQFIAAGLFGNGAGLAIIILTTLVVNLRHSLYSVTLAPHLKHLPQHWLAPLAFWLTDESFLVVVERYRHPDASLYKHWFFLGSAVLMYVNWNLCTWVGILAGQRLSNPTSWGLDFALIVTFIGMVAPALRSRPVIASVVTAGAGAIVLIGLPNRLGLIAAALIGVVAGMLAERVGAAHARLGAGVEVKGGRF